jgi:hypothetical protein
LPCRCSRALRLQRDSYAISPRCRVAKNFSEVAPQSGRWVYKVPDIRKSVPPPSCCSLHRRRRGGPVSIFKISPAFPFQPETNGSLSHSRVVLKPLNMNSFGSELRFATLGRSKIVETQLGKHRLVAWEEPAKNSAVPWSP